MNDGNSPADGQGAAAQRGRAVPAAGKAALTARTRGRGSLGRKDGKRKEVPELAADVCDLLRGLGLRVGAGDVDGLPALTDVIAEAEAALGGAVAQLRSEPWNYSWADVARRLGTSRQAAQMRFQRHVDAADTVAVAALADLLSHPHASAAQIGRRIGRNPRDVFRALDRASYAGRCQRWRASTGAWKWELPGCEICASEAGQ
jgi:hypothetical protein